MIRVRSILTELLSPTDRNTEGCAELNIEGISRHYGEAESR